jgi:hypothetical protein
MKCPNCKTENPPEERFCWRCHVPLEEEFRPQWGRFSALVRPNRRPLIVLFLVAAACGIFLGTYTLLRRGSPAGVAEAFLRARERGDLQGMYALISSPAKQSVGRAELAGLFASPSYGKVRFSVLGAGVKGKEAIVRVGVAVEMAESPAHPGALFPGRPFNLPMVREEKGWRVDIMKLMKPRAPAPKK